MQVDTSRLQLVAMSCIVVAAKYEEPEEKVPTAAMMNTYANNVYPPKMIHQMEVLLLNRLSWSLTMVTPLHYLGLFHSKGILFQRDSVSLRPIHARVLTYLQRYTEFFSELSLQDYSFYKHSPSLLAAAMVLASRRSLIIRPAWSHELQEVLQCTRSQVWPIFEELWQFYREKFPEDWAQAETQSNDIDTEILTLSSEEQKRFDDDAIDDGQLANDDEHISSSAHESQELNEFDQDVVPLLSLPQESSSNSVGQVEAICSTQSVPLTPVSTGSNLLDITVYPVTSSQPLSTVTNTQVSYISISTVDNSSSSSQPARLQTSHNSMIVSPVTGELRAFQQIQISSSSKKRSRTEAETGNDKLFNEGVSANYINRDLDSRFQETVRNESREI
jgi:Cyclin, C-terminal domain/Cyclin, N-terminal domain